MVSGIPTTWWSVTGVRNLRVLPGGPPSSSSAKHKEDGTCHDLLGFAGLRKLEKKHITMFRDLPTGKLYKSSKKSLASNTKFA